MKTTIQRAKRITWIGLAVNLVLAGVKFAFGFFGRSQAVLADAVHTVSDMATDLFILIGIKFWSAPADKCHPYGHQRIETIGTVGIASLLALAAVGIGWDDGLRTCPSCFLRRQ